MNLRIAEDLSLPMEAVGQTFGVVGKKRSGKTSTAIVFAEECLKRKLPVVIIDPLDATWGLKAGKDGESDGGYPIYVFGGPHADVPLEPTAGKMIADLIIDEHPPMILSLRHFESDPKECQFVRDLVEQLLRRGNNRPIPFIFDEAEKFAPENPQRHENFVLHAVDRFVRHGGKEGYGPWLVTQRPALISKNVLNQVDTMIFMRLVGPTDIKAVSEWIKRHGTPEERELVLSTLPKLQTGEGWVWSPEWLEILKRVRFRMKNTFDSSRTPRFGEKIAMPKELARVDIEALGAKITETIERAKAEDPKILHARIRELEGALAAKKPMVQATPPIIETRVERVEVPVLSPETERKLGAALTNAMDVTGSMMESSRGLLEALRDTGNAIREGTKRMASQPPRMITVRNAEPERGTNAPVRPMAAKVVMHHSVEPLNAPDVFNRAGVRRMLEALAMRHPGTLTRRELGGLSGAKHSGGYFGTCLSRLRVAGYIQEDGERIGISAAGIDALGDSAPSAPASAQEVLDRWGSRLRSGARKMFDALREAHPRPMTRAELAEATGIDQEGGYFGTCLSSLKTIGLVDVSRNEVSINATFA